MLMATRQCFSRGLSEDWRSSIPPIGTHTSSLNAKTAMPSILSVLAERATACESARLRLRPVVLTDTAALWTAAQHPGFNEFRT